MIYPFIIPHGPTAELTLKKIHGNLSDSAENAGIKQSVIAVEHRNVNFNLCGGTVTDNQGNFEMFVPANIADGLIVIAFDRNHGFSPVIEDMITPESITITL